jgi:N-acetylglucosamine-6-phosphate deacetylase
VDTTLVAAGRLRLPDGLGPGWLVVAGGRIVDAAAGPPPAAPDLELADGVLAPGLIDLQVNGAVGHDLGSADTDGWAEVAAWLLTTGVTAFAPTVITAPLEAIAAALDRHRQARGQLDGAGGARSLGVHVEGPFLAAARRGAHREELLVDPTPERVEQLLEAGQGEITYVTLAPERAGALEAIAAFVDAGIRVAVGHSDASDDQVLAAADAGATIVTHLYNGQRPLHHRDPGVVGAALSDPRFTLGLIVDLVHVAPTAVRVAFAAAAGRVALVTDATAALGMPPGRYELGGEEVTIEEGRPPVRDDGTLAGASLRLDAAVANTVACGIDLEVALDAATRAPADALGRADLGRIAPDARADLVWLDDDLRARATWVGGRLVAGREAAGLPQLG